MGISKSLNNHSSNGCTFTEGCKQMKQTHFIKGPFPDLMCLNINWFNNEVPYMDTLRFCASIPSKFRLSELLDISEPQKTEDE